ncbi:MAG: DUF1801 domain-containing protein [Actinobacteria bacterium]|nr:DUF1801 domain-containing protein [Actinomycetota bacterium]
MAELKTQPNDGDVDAFIASVENDRRRRDAATIKETMTRLSGEQPQMWGTSIVGYGTYGYRSGAGEQSSWFKIGFSPRKQALTLYIMNGFGEYEGLLSNLGNHSLGKSCLYIENLENVDAEILDELITNSLAHIDAAIEKGFEGTMPVGEST